MYDDKSDNISSRGEAMVQSPYNITFGGLWNLPNLIWSSPAPS